MADGRQFEKSLNRHSSAMVGQITRKFGIMMHFDPLKSSCRQKS